MTPDIAYWHFGHLERDLISVGNAPNNGPVKEAAKPTMMTRARTSLC
jgi:hypothetical protein